MMPDMVRIRAIFIKEIQDIRKNTNVVYMYFVPILLALLWNNFIPDMPAGFALGFSLMMLVVMVGMYVPSMIIAEEKEKKTIEVLMLSPATSTEIFVGKALLTFISIMLTALVLMLVTGNQLAHAGVLLLGTALTAVFAILLGMIVGLLAPNQMSTGIIGLPVYLLLLLVPQFAVMNVEIMKKIGQFLPTYYYFDMLNLALSKGLGLTEMFQQVIVLVISIVIIFFVFLAVFRRKGY